MATDELAVRLKAVLGADDVSEVVRLSGGASRETYRFTADARPLIVQRQRAGSDRSMALEASALRAAHGVGVPVAGVIASGESALGAPYIISTVVEGETIARKIQRDDAFSLARNVFASDCGAALARLHSLDPDDVPGLSTDDQLVMYRGVLDTLGEPHPTFELAFRWLESHRPPPGKRCVVHGDFRLGNLMMGPGGLSAVLDWELVHLGDPLEDLGWLCTRAWRFGGALPVGGLGTYDDLFTAYEAAGGAPVDPAAARWWEVLGTLKWGIMCILQASSHLSGATRSHELAAIGRRVCENEYDLFEALEGLW